MSVFGLDLGNLYSTVAIARRGGVDIALNEVSKRETPTIVSFGDKERLIGEKAQDNAIRNWKNTITCFKRLIGVKFNSPFADHERKFAKYEMRESKDGYIEVKGQYKGQVNWFSIEQICAMFFKRMEKNAERESQVSRVVDCVISCPVYYTAQQRRRLVAAAEMAELNVLNIMNETSAAALSYGIFRSGHLPEEEKNAERVMFIDVGQSATTITVATFWKGAMRVACHFSDPFVGVRDFVLALTNHYIEETLKKYKVDVREDKRSWFRLVAACERTVQVLSANNETILSCELADLDIQFPGVTRAHFESLIETELSRINNLISLAFKTFAPETVPSVEMIGGGSRIPAVKSLVRNLYGRDGSTTLNASEAIAKGCGINGAMLSPKFQVRDFQVNDSNMFAVHVGYRSEKGSDALPELPQFNKKVSLISVNGMVPKSLTLTFDRGEDFELACIYEPNELLAQSGNSTVLGRWRVSKVPPPSSGQKPNVKVSVRLNTMGQVDVDSAHVLEEYEVEEEVVEPTPTPPATAPSTTTTTTAEATNADQKKEGKEGEQTEGKMDVDEESKKEKEEPPKPEKKIVLKKKTRKIPCEVTRLFSMDVDGSTIQECKEKERVMGLADEKIQSNAEAKNTLETLIYDMQNKIADSTGHLSPFLSPTDRTSLGSILEDARGWVYGEGEDAEKHQYDARTCELKRHFHPAINRYETSIGIPVAHSELCRHLNETKAKTTDPKYSHLKPSELQTIIQKCDEIGQWAAAELNRYHATPKHHDPPLKPETIRQKIKDLEAFASPLLSRPKPTPAPSTSPATPAPAPAGPTPAGGAEGAAETQSGENKQDEAMKTD